MSTERTPLSRERVLTAAIELADSGGLESVTMRRLAEVLGAEAMSLYYHVSNKNDVLDGMADLIARKINEISVPETPGDSWKTKVRRRILVSREVLLAHRWAPGLFALRETTSPAIIAYHDTLIGLMHEGGLSYDLIHHGLHALGSRALGFSQELFATGNTTVPEEELQQLAAAFPHLAAMLREVAHDDPDSTLGWCDDQVEFEFGLDLILDGLQARAREAISRC